MTRTLASLAPWLFDSGCGARDRLLPRWLFLRALGLIYFSAFFSLVFQIRGLIGPQGILPAHPYLQEVAAQLGYARYWFAPTLLWISSSSAMLVMLCWLGMVASALLVFNLWPRLGLLICFVGFLSFVSAAQDFSSYQSDGMLLEAGFISLFFAPRGFRPGWGEFSPPSRASLFLLQWEWFRIYFESGVVKIASGDPQWRHMTAMDEYYQNGPLPTWIGWYVQHLPHWFHASATVATLVLELALVWMIVLPRRFRIACFFVVTLWQIPVILTANYAFLNYLVLVLGFLLLDDRFLMRFWPRRQQAWLAKHVGSEGGRGAGAAKSNPDPNWVGGSEEAATREPDSASIGKHSRLAPFRFVLAAVTLTWIFYASTAQLLWIFSHAIPLPSAPVSALEPFRIANQYGLFAVMTRGRYEIEFQGSEDGRTWIPYQFPNKPQDPGERPRVYAPYQPRFDWNLWFASLAGECNRALH
jgi:lipase maturation factor 1